MSDADRPPTHGIRVTIIVPSGGPFDGWNPGDADIAISRQHYPCIVITPATPVCGDERRMEPANARKKAAPE